MQEAFAAALERWPRDDTARQSAGLAGQCRTQQGDRPRAPANRVSRQAATARPRDRAQRGQPGRSSGRRDVRRRHAAADLHLLPSVIRARGAGRADLAHGLRTDHRAGRARVPGRRRGDGTAPGPRQAEDPPRRHRLRGAGARSAGAAAHRRARGDLSRLHRRLCRDLRRGADASRSRARGDPARPPARCADAGSGARSRDCWR